MRVELSFAPQLQANQMVKANIGYDYILRIIPAPDETKTVTAEVFDTVTGHIVALFVRYEYNPNTRAELIYG